jgi:hypothetical protein
VASRLVLSSIELVSLVSLEMYGPLRKVNCRKGNAKGLHALYALPIILVYVFSDVIPDVQIV